MALTMCIRSGCMQSEWLEIQRSRVKETDVLHPQILAKEVSTSLEMSDAFGLIMSLQNGRIRAAAAAAVAASFVASAPSARRLTVQRYTANQKVINQWKLRMNLAYLAAIADSQPQTPVVHSQLHISNERVAFCKDRL
ncbi:hypothetical protein Tco_0536367 [Tanacetum coccineum]